MDKKAIETLSVNAVRDSIVQCALLDQFIPDNDKEPSWDGHVYAYKNSSKRKEAFLGRIPVQVKGTEKGDLSKSKISFPVTFSKSDFRAVKVKSCEAVKKSKKLLKFVLDDGSGTDRVILSGIHDYYEPEELVGKTCVAIANLPPRPMMGIDSCGMLISAVHHEEGAEKLHLLMLDPHIPAGAKMY